MSLYSTSLTKLDTKTSESLILARLGDDLQKINISAEDKIETRESDFPAQHSAPRMSGQIVNPATYLLDTQHKQLIFATPLHMEQVADYLKVAVKKSGGLNLKDYDLIIPLIGQGVTEEHIVTLYKPKGYQNEAFVLDSKTSNAPYFFNLTEKKPLQALSGVFRALIPHYQKTLPLKNTYFKSIHYFSTGTQSYFDGISCGYHTLEAMQTLFLMNKNYINHLSLFSEKTIKNTLKTHFAKREYPLDEVTLILYTQALSSLDIKEKVNQDSIKALKKAVKKQLADPRIITLYEKTIQPFVGKGAAYDEETITTQLNKVIQNQGETDTFIVAFCHQLIKLTWPIIQDKSLDEIKNHALFQIHNSINQRLFFIIVEEILPTLASLKKSFTQKKITSFKKSIQNNLTQALSKNNQDASESYVNYITLAWNQSFSNKVEIKKWAILFSRPLTNRVNSQLVYILRLIIASPLILLYLFDSLFKFALVFPIHVSANTIGYLRDKLFLAENMRIMFQYGRSILLLTVIYPLFYLSKTFAMIVDQVISLITLMTPLQKISNSIAKLNYRNLDTVDETFADIEEESLNNAYSDNTAIPNDREIQSNSKHPPSSLSQKILIDNIFCEKDANEEKITQKLDTHSLPKDNVLVVQGFYRSQPCIENTAESVVNNGLNIKIK